MMRGGAKYSPASPSRIELYDYFENFKIIMGEKQIIISIVLLYIYTC